MGTALVGMVDDAAAFGVLTDDPHAKSGEDGEECEDEDGCHGVILNEFELKFDLLLQFVSPLQNCAD